jgi:Flp pilus assembly protein CpaB
MEHYSQPPTSRRGATGTNIIFGLTLAALAGLIAAYGYKTYVANAKTPAPSTAPAPQPTYQLTVAAVNLTDKALIHPGMIRNIAVSKEQYDRVTGNPKYLHGNQPLNRTTIKPIKAEEPIFEDMLEPLEYPKPVSLSLKAGKRAAVIEVPSRAAMVHVGDHVDVLCTLANDAFGLGRTATAAIAREARVVARFNSTRTAANPPPGDQTRTYTLELSPYRHALVELAKNMGGVFALSVSARPGEEGVVRDMAPMDEDPQTDHVTSADLAKVFGITVAPPPEIHRTEIERWVGVERRDIVIYEKPGAQAPKGSGGPSPRPAAVETPDATPAFSPPGPSGAPKTGRSSPPDRPATTTSYIIVPGEGTTLASASSKTDSSYAFRPPTGARSIPGCTTCGQKH